MHHQTGSIASYARGLTFFHFQGSLYRLRGMTNDDVDTFRFGKHHNPVFGFEPKVPSHDIAPGFTDNTTNNGCPGEIKVSHSC